jgi:hemolysin III
MWTLRALIPIEARNLSSELRMSQVNFPSLNSTHRRADFGVHLFGLSMILVAGGVLIAKSIGVLDFPLIAAVTIYVLSALVSNIASTTYHFSSLHEHRVLLRRIDHAAIYPSITGTFTPFFVLANTPWTITLLCISWALTGVAIWNKVTNSTVKSRWSTASYLGLGAIGLGALPHLTEVPVETLWFILGGSVSYVIGTMFYVRKTIPFRYSIWHLWVNIGSIFMFFGIWVALFGFN